MSSPPMLYIYLCHLLYVIKISQPYIYVISPCYIFIYVNSPYVNVYCFSHVLDKKLNYKETVLFEFKFKKLSKTIL